MAEKVTAHKGKSPQGLMMEHAKIQILNMAVVVMFKQKVRQRKEAQLKAKRVNKRKIGRLAKRNVFTRR